MSEQVYSLRTCIRVKRWISKYPMFQISYEGAGVFSTDLYTSKVVDIILNHNTSQPLFLYLAYQDSWKQDNILAGFIFKRLLWVATARTWEVSYWDPIPIKFPFSVKNCKSLLSVTPVQTHVKTGFAGFEICEIESRL